MLSRRNLRGITTIVLCLSLFSAIPAIAATTTSVDPTPGASTPSLSAQDITVKTLQTFLVSKGLLVMTQHDTAGHFGAKTQAALITYQNSVGLPAQGIFGPQTKAKIAEELSLSAPASPLVPTAAQSTTSIPTNGDKPVTQSDLQGIYKMIADSQHINNLTNTNISGGTISGASISGTSISGLTTDGVGEGRNLYYTDGRADARLSATSSLPNIRTLSGLTSIGTSGTTTTFNGNVAIGATVSAGNIGGDGWYFAPGKNGAVCDGSTDDSPAFAALLQTVYNAGGGIIRVVGRCKLTTDIGTLPYNGNAGTPLQAPLRITGPVNSASFSGTTMPGGAGILDFRYNSAVGKIDTRGFGQLEIDHLTIMDGGSDCAPFIHTTNTTLNIHENTFVGTAALTAACNDAIVLGGTSSVRGNGANAPFGGYGTVVEKNWFSKIRRVLLFGTFSNNSVVRDNYIGSDNGSSLTDAISSCTNANPVVCAVEYQSIPTGTTSVYNISGFTGNWTPLNGAKTITGVNNSHFSIAVDSTAFGAVTGAPVYLTGSAIDLPSAGSQSGNNISDNLIETTGYAYGIRCGSNCNGNNKFSGNSNWDPGTNWTIAGYSIAGPRNTVTEGHSDLTTSANVGNVPASSAVTSPYGSGNLPSLAVAGVPISFAGLNGGTPAPIPFLNGAGVTFAQDINNFVWNNSTKCLAIGLSNCTSAIHASAGSFGATTPTYNFITSSSTSGFANVGGFMAPNMANGDEAYMSLGSAESTNNRASWTFHQTGAGSASNYQYFGWRGGTPNWYGLPSGKISTGAAPSTTGAQLQVTGGLQLETGTNACAAATEGTLYYVTGTPSTIQTCMRKTDASYALVTIFTAP
jgi:peptidoglycan hydrolase-like protein with peptidoglycan-binding domain